METIFLSYAREDKDSVRGVYTSFKKAGLNPWMDDPPSPWELDGIAPGQDWDHCIRSTLKEASVILAFLSKRAIEKQGYVQREYRLALSLMMEKPPDSVSLIPVLLEDCAPPDLRVDTISLRQFNWYRLYEKGVDYLITYLRKITAPPDEKSVERHDDSQNLEVITLQNRVRQLEYMTKDIADGKDKAISRLEEELARWRNQYLREVGSREITDKLDRIDRGY
jgi:hypothetical protein